MPFSEIFGGGSGATAEEIAAAVLAAAVVTPIRSDLRLVNGLSAELVEQFSTNVPSSAIGTGRAGSTYIIAYVQETGDYSISVFDESLSPVDLTGLTLGIYFETRDREAVAQVTTGVTISGAGNNAVVFALPSTVTESKRELIFAIRLQAAPKTVIAGGVFDVQYLPVSV